MPNFHAEGLGKGAGASTAFALCEIATPYPIGVCDSRWFSVPDMFLRHTRVALVVGFGQGERRLIEPGIGPTIVGCELFEVRLHDRTSLRKPRNKDLRPRSRNEVRPTRRFRVGGRRRCRWQSCAATAFHTAVLSAGGTVWSADASRERTIPCWSLVPGP
jgi:hypothetical protein